MSRPYRRRAVLSAHRAYSRDPLEQIEGIGGINADRTKWNLSQAAAIAAIEAGTDEFFITIEGANIKLIVLLKEGQKYLQTARTSTHPNDLLSLIAV
jgi:hypothetical protein